MMKRFKNILVSTDSRKEETGLIELAASLARSNRARLTLAEVLKHFPSYMSLLGPKIDVEELERGLTVSRREALERTASALVAEGIDVGVEILWGAPVVEIVREVLRSHHDLVIKTAGDEGWLAENFLGTTDLQLLRKCPAPVWIVRPNAPARFARIVAAVDAGADEDRVTERRLNSTVLELASSIAARFSSRLDVVYCWSVPGGHLLEPRMPREEFESLRVETKARASTAFDALLRTNPEFRAAEPRLLEGEPGLEIPRFAASVEADLIVLGTVGRTGIPGVLIGNTAERVLGAARTSVLAVKPEGFETPITPRPELLGGPTK
jgi:universal stress protein E